MIDAVKNLTSCKDRDELFDSLCSEAAALGFEFVVFAGIAGDDRASHEIGYPAISSSYPREWSKRYAAGSYHEIDPIVCLTPVTATTMNWRDLHNLKPSFFDEASSFGLRTGFSIPVLLPQRVYLMSFATARDEVAPESVQSTLEGLSFSFIQRYVRKLPRSPSSVVLSDNTLKILHMSLAGFSSEAIASSLGMTVHGVSWHLRDARDKLRCQTTLQACGKALSLGLIKL